MTTRFLEGNNVVSQFLAVDMSVAANPGVWVSLAQFAKVVFVLQKAAGAVGEPPIFTLTQATDNAGTGAKALNIDTIFAKNGALASTAQFTKITQVAGPTYTPAAGNVQGVIAVEVRAEELDVANGFGWVRLSIPKVGITAQLGSAFAVMLNPKYAVEPSVSAQ